MVENALLLKIDYSKGKIIPSFLKKLRAKCNAEMEFPMNWI
jgi:hypothetical protein